MNDITRARLDDACKALNRAIEADRYYQDSKRKPVVYDKGRTLLVVRRERIGA